MTFIFMSLPFIDVGDCSLLYRRKRPLFLAHLVNHRKVCIFSKSHSFTRTHQMVSCAFSIVRFYCFIDSLTDRYLLLCALTHGLSHLLPFLQKFVRRLLPLLVVSSLFSCIA